MLINFYGKECPHCITMHPLIQKLRDEEDVIVEDREVWHDKDNAHLLETYDKNLCGGVPFLYNTETKNFICGEASYEELKAWAGIQ